MQIPNLFYIFLSFREYLAFFTVHYIVSDEKNDLLAGHWEN